jgi:hypothetical protein
MRKAPKRAAPVEGAMVGPVALDLVPRIVRRRAAANVRKVKLYCDHLHGKEDDFTFLLLCGWRECSRQPRNGAIYMTTNAEELTIDELDDVSGGCPFCLALVWGAVALVSGFDAGLYLGSRIALRLK